VTIKRNFDDKSKNTASYIPPRPPQATSMTSLLQLIQNEHDALLLELFDTRRTLEETRTELSQALYANDAAVRVIARVCVERDDATRKLSERPVPVPPPPKEDPKPADTEMADVPAAKKQKLDDDAPKSPDSKIPDADLEIMTTTWKSFSKSRKSNTKAAALVTPPPVKLSEYTEFSSKSLHRSNKPGVTHLSVSNETVTTAGVDKSVICYNSVESKIESTVSGTKEILDMECAGGYVVTARVDGVIVSKGDDAIGKPLLLEKGEAVAGVSIHPTHQYFVVCGVNGSILFCRLEDASVICNIANASNEDGEAEVKYTSCGMHPDGLIFGVGTSVGTIQVWDLKGQKIASTLQGHTSKPVRSLTFSESGYHAASLTSDAVILWDLRKIKSIAVLPVSDDKEAVQSMAFDPAGKYLALAGGSKVSVLVVKDSKKEPLVVKDCKGDRVGWLVQEDAEKKKQFCLVTAGKKDKALRLYGMKEEEKDAKMEE